MARLDRAMMADFRINLIQMMENAGRALAIVVWERFLDSDPEGCRYNGLMKPFRISAALCGTRAAGLWAGAPPKAVAQDREARVVFVGDTGTGDRRAREVRDSILSTARSAGLSQVFLLGDNIYENGAAEDIERRFINIYRPVMDRGVAVRAVLGNHDVKKCDGTDIRPVPRDASAYKPARDCWAAEHLATPEFGYEDGARYYSVIIPDDRVALVEVFMIDSNTLGED